MDPLNLFNLSLPRQGDFQQGGPNSTYQRAGTSPTDLVAQDQPQVSVTDAHAGTLAAHPVLSWFVILLAAILVKWGFDRIRKPGETGVSFIEWFVVGALIVVLQLNFVKWIAVRWYVEGPADVVLAA